MCKKDRSFNFLQRKTCKRIKPLGAPTKDKYNDEPNKPYENPKTIVNNKVIISMMKIVNIFKEQIDRLNR